MMSPLHAIDPKIAGLIEEQAKHLEEQETMIKTLNKQLTHCEADLQAHMDLVATLESSLTDSERNRESFAIVLQCSILISLSSPKSKDAGERSCQGT